jgi:hypothetical protein
MLIHDNKVFDELREEGLKRISLLKQSLSSIITHDKQLDDGSRWNDNNRIFYTACGMVVEFMNKQHGNAAHERNEDEALEYMKSLTQQELDQYYIDAAIDAASCDYYYKYEKDWG